MYDHSSSKLILGGVWYLTFEGKLITRSQDACAPTERVEMSRNDHVILGYALAFRCFKADVMLEKAFR